MTEKGEVGLSDASALLDLVIGASGEDIDKVFDLSKLPRKMMEIERKYWLTPEDGDIDSAITKFFARFGKFLEKNNIAIEKLITFVGIDQYYIINRSDSEFAFRYRLGANRPPQLTVKFQVDKGSNLVRGELNLNIRYEEPEKVRAFLAVIAKLADTCQIFTVQQSGNIWITKDSEGNLVEVVVYKTARITPPERLEAFVEIEPLNSEKVDQVVRLIARYEKALQLGDFICEESIAELFREA